MLRGLAESFVVSPPSGVTIKTRLRPTPAEEQALREVGTFLGSLYRADLVRRLGEGKLDAQGRAAPGGGRVGKIAGYRSAGERHGKTRRLAQLTARLGVVDTTLASGRPSVVPGGRRLWRTRNNLAQANLSVQAWESLWARRRMFPNRFPDSPS